MPSPDAIQVAEDLLYLCRGAAPLSSENGYFLAFNDEFGRNDQVRLDYADESPDAMWSIAEDIIKARCVDGRVRLAVMGRADLDGAYRAVAFVLVDDVALMETYDEHGLHRRAIQRNIVPDHNSEWHQTLTASRLGPVIGLVTLHNRGRPNPYIDHLLGLFFP